MNEAITTSIQSEEVDNMNPGEMPTVNDVIIDDLADNEASHREIILSAEWDSLIDVIEDEVFVEIDDNGGY